MRDPGGTGTSHHSFLHHSCPCWFGGRVVRNGVSVLNGLECPPAPASVLDDPVGKNLFKTGVVTCHLGLDPRLPLDLLPPDSALVEQQGAGQYLAVSPSQFSSMGHGMLDLDSVEAAPPHPLISRADLGRPFEARPAQLCLYAIIWCELRVERSSLKRAGGRWLSSIVTAAIS